MEIFPVPPSDLEYKSPMCSTANASNLNYTLVVTVEMSMRDDECGPQQLSDIVRYLWNHNTMSHFIILKSLVYQNHAYDTLKQPSINISNTISVDSH